MAAATTTRAIRLLALSAGAALALALAGPARGSEADAAAAAASAALIERIAAAHRAIASIQGRATMRTSNRDEPAGEARVKLVQFFLLFPDHYRLVFTEPGDDEGRDIYLSDGVQCERREYLFKGDAPTSRVTPVGADDAEITRLLTCFRLDLPAINADFTAITVDLDATFVITRFTMSDPQGNRRQITIDQSDYDKPIASSTFQVTGSSAPPSPGK
jgi:outer membrane lipoprotein-sorting protein